MKSLMLLTLCSLLTACAASHVTRTKGDTVDGYTSYKTVVHLEMTDEPVCHGTCKP